MSNVFNVYPMDVSHPFLYKSPMRVNALFVPVVGLLACCTVWSAPPSLRVRSPIRIPDLPEYKTLKCDFHIHTVFSDGSVWPNVRVEEAWREGLDAIAITDHIEYQPHKKDIPTNHGRAHEIAQPLSQELDIVLIRGSEITRSMPPGHLNAIFLKDAKELDVDDWREALEEAHEQGAFIFWNHPGWQSQQPDGVAKWYAEHTELLEGGMINGIEVVNGRSYYPESHRWCLEKELTMFSNSDIHSPIHHDYDLAHGSHRPLTLVFATEKTAEAIQDALWAQRTAVYADDRLIGREQFIRPIFERSVRPLDSTLQVKGKQQFHVQLRNDSDLNYELEVIDQAPPFSLPRTVRIPAGKIALLTVSIATGTTTGHYELPLAYRVKNLLTAPDEALQVNFPISIDFQK